VVHEASSFSQKLQGFSFVVTSPHYPSGITGAGNQCAVDERYLWLVECLFLRQWLSCVCQSPQILGVAVFTNPVVLKSTTNNEQIKSNQSKNKNKNKQSKSKHKTSTYQVVVWVHGNHCETLWVHIAAALLAMKEGVKVIHPRAGVTLCILCVCELLLFSSQSRSLLVVRYLLCYFCFCLFVFLRDE